MKRKNMKLNNNISSCMDMDSQEKHGNQLSVDDTLATDGNLQEGTSGIGSIAVDVRRAKKRVKFAESNADTERQL